MKKINFTKEEKEIDIDSLEKNINARVKEKLLSWQQSKMNKLFNVVTILMSLFAVAIPIIILYFVNDLNQSHKKLQDLQKQIYKQHEKFTEINYQAEKKLKDKVEEYDETLKAIIDNYNSTLKAKNQQFTKIINQKEKKLDKLVKTQSSLVSKKIRLIYESKQALEDKKYGICIKKCDALLNIDNEIYVAYLYRGKAFFFKERYNKTILDMTNAIQLSPSYDAFLYRGESYERLGKLTNALADYNELVKLDNKKTIAYLRRGSLYVEQKLFSLAIKEFSKAILIDNKCYKAYVLKASTHLNMDNSKNAMIDSSLASKINKQGYEAYYIRGKAKLNLKLTNEAIEDFNYAIFFNKKTDADVFMQRGIAYTQLKKYSSALDNYNKAIEIQNNNYIAICNKGRLFFAQKKYDKAIKCFNKTISIVKRENKEYKEVFLYRGLCQKAKQEYLPAIQDFSIVIDYGNRVVNFDTQKLAKAYLNRGECYGFINNPNNNTIYINQKQFEGISNMSYSMQDDIQAQKDIEKSLLLSNNKYKSFFTAGVFCYNRGWFQKAIDSFSASLLLEKVFSSYVFRGFCYAMLNKYALAYKDLNIAIELEPDKFEGYNIRGSIFLKQGKIGKADKDFNKAMSINSNNSALYNNVGCSYALAGEHELAIKYLKKSLKLAPEDNMTLYTLADVYIEEEEYDLAVASYKKLLKISSVPVGMLINATFILISINQFDEANRFINHIGNLPLKYHNRVDYFLAKAIIGICQGKDIQPIIHKIHELFNIDIAKKVLINHTSLELLRRKIKCGKLEKNRIKDLLSLYKSVYPSRTILKANK